MLPPGLDELWGGEELAWGLVRKQESRLLFQFPPQRGRKEGAEMFKSAFGSESGVWGGAPALKTFVPLCAPFVARQN